MHVCVCVTCNSSYSRSRRRLCGDCYQKVNCTKYISGSTGGTKVSRGYRGRGVVPGDTCDGLGACLFNLCLLGESTPSARGWVTSPRGEICPGFNYFFYNFLWREQKLCMYAWVKLIPILTHCTQEASGFCLILWHVAKSTHRRWHGSWELSPYCTLLGLADIEIGCQLPTGGLSLALGSIQ